MKSHSLTDKAFETRISQKTCMLLQINHFGITVNIRSTNKLQFPIEGCHST